MQCPYCSHTETRVLESRLAEKSLRRRRECLQCSKRFTTYEQAVFQLTVLKKDGREEPFQLSKISASLQKACGKTEPDILNRTVQRIEQKILLKKMNPIATRYIGKIVLSELKKVDKMAYLRFASVHKSIHDPRILEKELKMVI